MHSDQPDIILATELAMIYRALFISDDELERMATPPWLDPAPSKAQITDEVCS